MLKRFCSERPPLSMFETALDWFTLVSSFGENWQIVKAGEQTRSSRAGCLIGSSGARIPESLSQLPQGCLAVKASRAWI